MTASARTALVVVDLQNDFCASPLARARFRGDPAVLDAVVSSAAGAAAEARRRGVEVVFVRFTGDPDRQGASWRLRDRARGRPPKCLEGTWGAEFHGVLPAAGEAVFTKRACFDAFLAAGFEEHLRARGVEHLVFAGLFADVCVDSTARTAFQKGFHVTVLADCTTALHLPYEEVLAFMRVLYGARTPASDDPSAWDVPSVEPRREEEEEGECAPVPVRSRG
ncbi:cysteine hydrolase family protein [Streptomyces sp. WAC08241]|uniref:cysteine hydrolase family protein n=1 Tax=Streptomyces sp. WAC08241 TaxID=2487421 RepID=UPI000F76F33B|nr:isochorismatase family cysteine hydrolase [Streptomyces sp. WAC08241]RSS43902.1 cysteine hydrolase [Streptomyces sp. WAC08241]